MMAFVKELFNEIIRTFPELRAANTYIHKLMLKLADDITVEWNKLYPHMTKK